MNQINKLFINTTWACNMNCPRCYIPKNLRDDSDSRLDTNYLKQTLKHPSIDRSNNTVAIYMGGEPSIVGESKLREYMNIVTKHLPNAEHTIVTNLFNLPKWLMSLSLKEYAGQIETTYANGGKQTLSGNESKYQQKFIKNLGAVTQAGINCTVNVELNLETIQAGIQPIISIMKQSGAKDWAFDYSVNFDEFNNNPIYDRFNYPVLNASTTLKAYWDFVSAITQNNWVVNNNISIASRSDGFNVLEAKNFLTINANNTLTTNPLFTTMKPLEYLDIDTLNKSGIRAKHHTRATNPVHQTEVVNQILPKRETDQILPTKVVNQVRPCISCSEFDDCHGFSSHVPTQDGSGVCAGGLDVQYV